MRANRVFNSLSALIISMAWLANAQESSSRAAIQSKLEAQFPPTKATADKTDIVTAGAVLVLKKDNLQMVGASSSNPCQSVFKDGKISQNLMSKITCMKRVPGVSTPSTRTFVAGEKLWATRIDVRDNGIVFELLTDAIGEVRYKAILMFPFAKGNMPTVDEAVSTVGEVFKVQPAEATDSAGAGGGEQQQQPSPQPARQARPGAPSAPPPPPPSEKREPIPPPPPPPDKPEPIPPPPPVAEEAPTVTIGVGSTIEQVVAAYGKPIRTAKGTDKEFYFYKDLKITFVKGKVTDVQ